MNNNIEIINSEINGFLDEHDINGNCRIYNSRLKCCSISGDCLITDSDINDIVCSGSTKIEKSKIDFYSKITLKDNSKIIKSEFLNSEMIINDNCTVVDSKIRCIKGHVSHNSNIINSILDDRRTKFNTSYLFIDSNSIIEKSELADSFHVSLYNGVKFINSKLLRIKLEALCSNFINIDSYTFDKFKKNETIEYYSSVNDEQMYEKRIAHEETLDRIKFMTNMNNRLSVLSKKEREKILK